MNLVLKLSTLAVRTLVDGACKAAGVTEVKEAALRVVKILNEHFTDHSQRLTAVLRTANERAWRALELSLAGDSLWERCKAATVRTEDKAVARQVRAFLDGAVLPESSGGPAFRQKCLQELRAVHTAGLLTTGILHPQELAEQAAVFVRFSDPQSLIDGEGRIIEGMARELKEAGYVNLALLLIQRPEDGRPLLVTAARYFFRRAVEEDAKLFQGLAFAQLERLDKGQEEGFAALHALMSQQGKRLEEMLADVRAVVIETHSAVLDLRGQVEGQSGQLQEIGVAVQKLLEQHQLHRREVRPGDSLSIRNDNERQLVKQLVARYRALPEADRRQVPALLNGIGKLEVVAGDFDAACKDFAAVATLVEDNKVQAEAHFNAYQACLERRDWPTAIQEFIKAVKLDPKRFASFPVGKYHPQRILGAGGFGVAFLCKHKYMDAQVVVKALHGVVDGEDAERVFAEAIILRKLDHPAIVRVSECGFVDSTSRSRPFLVLDHFDGLTLDEYVARYGPLAPEELPCVMIPVAEALLAAHQAGILHRDVKPANVLIRRDRATWRVKLIDFGLALRQGDSREEAINAKERGMVVDGSIAGTFDYAPPEQLGRLPGVKTGVYSDIFGFGKTCCFALFKTVHLRRALWQALPSRLAELLDRCIAEQPAQRFGNFIEVLAELRRNERLAPGEIRRLKGHRGVVNSIAFLPDGRRLVSGSSDKTVRLWDIDTGKESKRFDSSGEIESLSVSLDCHYIITAGEDGIVSLWDLESGKELRKFLGHGEIYCLFKRRVHCVAFSPDGDRALTGGSDQSIRLWDVHSGKEIWHFSGPVGDVWSVAFSPDGRRAVSGSHDQSIRVWDVEKAEQLCRLGGFPDFVKWILSYGIAAAHFFKAVRAVTFAADGSSILSAGNDGLVRLWDSSAGKEYGRLHGHDTSYLGIMGGVTSIAVTGDGRWALSGGVDKTIRLWDLRTQSELCCFSTSEPVLAVAFSPKGDKAACASGKTVHLWDLPGS